LHRHLKFVDFSWNIFGHHNLLGFVDQCVFKMSMDFIFTIQDQCIFFNHFD
jgi:hypothetical protein